MVSRVGLAALALGGLALFCSQLAHGNPAQFTTNFGAPVYSNQDSLTVGKRGPVLLEDFYTQEKLATINRERIPERVVHARGTAAKGYFKVTNDITALSSADVFSAVGKVTDVTVRFSIVTASRGTPEWTRDPRGFAVKFYTQEGNWDLVGNNFPVFFLRDGNQFPDLVHAVKLNPVSGLNDAWRVADFFSWHPESMHVLTYQFDDVGIPKDYRHMNGSSVHTYTLVNASGAATLVKFHWVPTVGVESLLDADIPALAAKSPDGSFATQDLADAIAAGDFPEWQLWIQTLPPADAQKFDFDPLDPTKTWPEAQFPLMRVGSLVLNQNPDNYFNDVEQLAFSPGRVVPGITYSDDKLLQWRIIAYDDAERYRIGPNFGMLPINRPRCPFRNDRQDGPMNIQLQRGEVNYYPSEYIEAAPVDRLPMAGANIAAPNGQCTETRDVIDKQDNFKQAAERYLSWDPARQARYIARITALITAPKVNAGIQNRWLANLQQMDGGLAAKVRAGIAAAGPASAAAFEAAPASPLDAFAADLGALAPAPRAAPEEMAVPSGLAPAAAMAAGRRLKQR